ncbi:MAG TPA: hypothetical protein VFR81_23195, partial [Longimicrobium sp.]|nr:hypothetical protein [Longimicrobium sp.]
MFPKHDRDGHSDDTSHPQKSSGSSILPWPNMVIILGVCGGISFVIGIVAASVGLGQQYFQEAATANVIWAGVWWTVAFWCFWGISKVHYSKGNFVREPR